MLEMNLEIENKLKFIYFIQSKLNINVNRNRMNKNVELS